MKTIAKRTLAVGIFLFLAHLFLSTSVLLFAQNAPVNLNFEQGTLGQLPTGWQQSGPVSGYTAGLTNESPISGAMCGVIRRAGAAAQNDFGTLMQSFNANAYRSRRVRFRAAVRTAVTGSGNKAQLWLRVDLPNGQTGFFDNMSNRPITTPAWNYFEITGDVAANATQINFGLILNGSGTAWIDDCTFDIVASPDPIVEAPRPLTSCGLQNVIAFTRLLGYVRHFHPSDEAAATDWDRFAVEGMRRVENESDAGGLAEELESLFRPVAPTLSVFRTGDQASVMRAVPPPSPAGSVRMVAWRHYGFGTGAVQSAYQSTRVYTDAPGGKVPETLAAYQEPFQADLGGGVSCSIPLALFADSTGTWPRGAAPGPSVYIYSARDRATRLAAAALAWNVFQHFYPYFDVVSADWPAALTAALTSAATDADERAFLDTLRRLVAALHDGHGNVYNSLLPTQTYVPPLTWDWMEGRLVLTTVQGSVPGLSPGDVVLKINGKPAADALADVESLISGATPQWIRYKGLLTLAWGNKDDALMLEIDPWASPGKSTEVTVTRSASYSSVTEPRPEKIAELEPGIYYVNLDKISDSDFEAALSKLELAKGIIFDMRGYPSNLNPSTLFPHITEEPVTSAQWNIPILTFPDQKDKSFYQSRWTYMPPDAPYLKARKAFITDGRAISYAESCMGIVENYRLGEIVGGPTAGTNGNVNPFYVPGGYQIYWTGMKVLKHDGSQHHGIGILPTVPASRTRAGAAAGVDELLQRAIQIVSPAPELEIQLPAAGGGAASTIGGGSPVRFGYATAEVTSGSAPYGVAVYSYKNSGGVIVGEAAVPVSPPTTSARIFVENRSGVSMPGLPGAAPVDVTTGIALVNGGSADAHVSYTLRDKAGVILAAGSGRVAGKEHVAKLITQLNDLAPDLKVPDNFSAEDGFGSLDVTSDQPLSVLALRITVNQRRETLLTSTPVADLTKAKGGAPLYVPQFIGGGGYWTTLILLNTSTVLETGKLALFDGDGTPLIVTRTDGTSGSTFDYSIQPNGVFLFQSAGSTANSIVGWLRVSPDAETPSPAGAAVFSGSRAGILVTESGVDAAPLTTHARIYVDHSGHRGTGLAIANPGVSEITVTAAAYEQDGKTPAGITGDPLKLHKSGRAAVFVAELISGLPAGFSGILDISSPSPFAAVTLQTLTNSRGDFLLTTFPVADATQPAPAPIVFPHIADGAGYLTRFILFGSGSSSSAVLRFHGDDGMPLPIGSTKGAVKY